MPVVQYSKRDLLRDKLVEPNWYTVLIDTVGEWSPSKDQKSQNMVMEGTIIRNAETGSEEFKDVPIGGMGAWSFNTKALGFSLGLVKAVAPQLDINPDQIDATTKIEFKHLEGKLVDLYIVNDTYEGRLKNKVDHRYRAPKVQEDKMAEDNKKEEVPVEEDKFEEIEEDEEGEKEGEEEDDDVEVEEDSSDD